MIFFLIDLSLNSTTLIFWRKKWHIRLRTLIWNSSKLDKESEYLCFLLCSVILGISISMISRVGWLFWGLENIISSSSWSCVTGPSSAIDNFDRSVSHLLESDSIDPCRENQKQTYRTPEGWLFSPRLRESFCRYRCNWNMDGYMLSDVGSRYHHEVPAPGHVIPDIDSGDYEAGVNKASSFLLVNLKPPSCSKIYIILLSHHSLTLHFLWPIMEFWNLIVLA